MNETDKQFTGSIPETYDRHLGPLWFAPYATDLARRARSLGPRRVLEIAAGSGIVTRALVAALPEASIEATDLNEAMVSSPSARETAPRVRWSAVDAMSLPFSQASFDLVVCQFGVMFFPDRPRAFREARRVLQAGGTYLFNVWDTLEHNDFARVASDAVAAMFPEDPPSFFRRVPYGIGPEAVERDLRECGFDEIVFESVEQRSRARSAGEAASGICEGTPLRHEILSRDSRALGDAVEAAERALRNAFGEGPIEGAMRAFVFSVR